MAISLAKKYGFKIEKVNINTSGLQWEISEDSKTLIQPLSSIKGLGEKAIKQIMDHRPFNTPEDLLFNEEITYSKLNKKGLDALCRSGALNDLIDERFTGLKHFWAAVVDDRPKNKKKFKENIEIYEKMGDFSNEKRIYDISELTGLFPFELVMNEDIISSLEQHCVPPLGKWDNNLKVAWFIPREIVKKKTKNGKPYWIVNVIDTTATATKIRCWGVRDSDKLHLNRPYMAKLDYNDTWGFSTRSMYHNFKLLG